LAADLAYLFLMKKLIGAILSLAAVSAFVVSPALAAEPASAPQGKITKNEAQHLVLKKYPGARVVSCESKTANGNAVWVVTFAETGSNANRSVTVDEQTGKITR
jgi:uncharacterized membrane protein YkoI